MGDQIARSIPIHNFRSGVDEPSPYLTMFENSVDLVQPTADDNARQTLLKNWFPLKLDDRARLAYGGIPQTAETTWNDIKTAFIDALTDPQEEYTWHARREFITWDSVESFRSLFTKIKSKVDKYEHANVREREYFFRFRMALPRHYRREIDINLPRERRKVEEAIDIAERIRLANSEAAESNQAAAAPNRPFTGAAMRENQYVSVELGLANLTSRFDGIDETLRSINERLENVNLRN